MSFLYDHTEQLLEQISYLTIAITAIAVIMLIVNIALLLTLFETNNKLKDIRKISIKEYNEKHPDDKFREERPYEGADYNGMLN